jgi:Ca2+/Na+ antiporter
MVFYMGNGVGSVICNTGLILGLTCILARVPVDRFFLNRTGLVLIGAGSLMVLFSLQAYVVDPDAPVLHRWVGLVFLSPDYDFSACRCASHCMAAICTGSHGLDSGGV